jgi:CheY-like chemotaxis protein
MALDYLSGVDKYADRQSFPLPFIVFLDLKLPYVGGFEVLSWMREQPHLEAISVVILTSSDEEKDHQKGHILGATKYLVKPPTDKDLIEAVTITKLKPA